MIYQQLYARAVAHSGLNALIGTRCYAMRIPQDVTTLPAVTMQEISHAGASQRNTVNRPRYQFIAHGSNYEEAHSVAVQIFDAFEAWGTTSRGDVIVSMSRINQIDLPYDELRDRHRVLVDFEAYVNE